MNTTPLNKMGSNMIKVFGRLAKQLDQEPKLANEAGTHPSNDWVLWYMRQTGCARAIALNRAYELFDFEGDRGPSINLLTLQPFEVDEGLKVLGINRMADYFATTGAVLNKLVQTKSRFPRLPVKR